jgi:hypothetical protein
VDLFMGVGAFRVGDSVIFPFSADRLSEGTGIHRGVEFV